MAARTADPELLSSGVDVLIARLREEGVAAGRNEGNRILAEARAEARRILDKANAEALDRLETSRKEADAYRSAGEQALRTAMRDAILDMKSTLMERFSSDVKRLVARELEDESVLRQMILAVAGRVAEDAEIAAEGQLRVRLPETVVGLEELRRRPEELREGPLTKYVLGLTGEMLREGVTLYASEDRALGIRIEVEDKNIVLDLTEEAVAALLLQHLQPRFRAILEGIVK